MPVRPTEPLGPDHVSRYRSFVARRREPGGNQFNRSGEEFIKSQLHRPQRNRILRSIFKSLLRLPRDMTSICHYCPLVTRKGSAVPMLGFLFVHPSYRNPCFIFTASHGKEKLHYYCTLTYYSDYYSYCLGLRCGVPLMLMTCLHSWHTCISRKSRPGLRSDRLCGGCSARGQRSATTVTTTKGIAGRGHALAFLFWCNRIKSVPVTPVCLSVKNMFQFYAHYLVPLHPIHI